MSTRKVPTKRARAARTTPKTDDYTAVLLEELRGQLKVVIEALQDRVTKTELDARFDQVDARFDQVDARFDQVDARFDRLEGEVRTLRHEVLGKANEATIAALDGRVTALERRVGT